MLLFLTGKKVCGTSDSRLHEQIPEGLQQRRPDRLRRLRGHPQTGLRLMHFVLVPGPDGLLAGLRVVRRHSGDRSP